jgi:acetyltransferase-like isoleucine patch superfamily enzyme
MQPEAQIEIGSDTGISGGVICAALSVKIGKECLLGADVMIVDNDFHPINADGRRYNRNLANVAAAPVVVGDNVFIGARSIVLKGVSIGSNSVIGAGSVVVGNIPSGVIAAGVPARVIREI